MPRDAAAGGAARAGAVADQVVVDWLNALRFQPNTAGSRWEKRYSAGQVIEVDIPASSIDYGAVRVVSRTSSNLSDLENLVILDCVDLLLAVGYDPNLITLEKTFRLGRRNSGRLDIHVQHPHGHSYLIIEAKTAGSEYRSELTRLKTEPENQLMSYLQQDDDTEHAILYSSALVSSPGGGQTIAREYAGLNARNLHGSNIQAKHASWDKETYSTGLETSAPYSLVEASITIGELRDMTQADGAALFNSFKETLRRHAVSDKPNAFNKIFNLFICKIWDESKRSPTAVTDFQWRATEASADVLERLSALYAAGMRNYLRIDAQDPAEVDLNDALRAADPFLAEQIRRLVARSRQFRNSEFAFIDVYDQATFDQNASIVRDVVRLLERMRLRYSQKHGFLGMFFEKLLNTSMKQESGQFFTPVPIAQFVNEALPVEAIVASKIRAGETDFLPFVIDYAAGSGHFLTEFMSRTDRILQSLSVADLTSLDQEQALASWGSYLWAGRFVYGVELDYRLAKAAKVSTFLNGDGQAHIIRGDGLGHFEQDASFAADQGRLTRAAGRAGAPYRRDHQVFDVLVANPPYSVADFQSGVDRVKESFELASDLPASSDKIEALFVERAKQLLVDGGVAGIILPTSLLSNSGVEARAREMLLRYFDVVAVVSLGGHVFIATSTPTSIVFLRRRPNRQVEQLREAAETFAATDGSDLTLLGHANVVSRYAQDVHGLTLDAYHAALVHPSQSDAAFVADFAWEYHSRRRGADEGGTEFSTEMVAALRAQEADRLEAYVIGLGKTVLQVTSPDATADERLFLGYKFSERKRHEGISLLSGTDRIETPLFDPDDPYAPEKFSTLIKNRFDDASAVIPPSLAAWAQNVPAHDLMGVRDPVFAWSMTGRPQDRAAYTVPTERLGSCASLSIGGTPARQRPDFFRGNHLWVSVSELDGGVVEDTREKITDEAVANSNVKLVRAGTLLMSFKLSIGRTGIAGADMYTNEAIVAVSPRPAPPGQDAWVDTEYLHALIDLFADEVLGHATQGRKKIGTSLNLAFLRRVPIPLLDANSRAEFVRAARDETIPLAGRRQAASRLLWGNPGGR